MPSIKILAVGIGCFFSSITFPEIVVWENVAIENNKIVNTIDSLPMILQLLFWCSLMFGFIIFVFDDAK